MSQTRRDVSTYIAGRWKIEKDEDGSKEAETAMDLVSYMETALRNGLGESARGLSCGFWSMDLRK
jgi:hypothetical protein